MIDGGAAAALKMAAGLVQPAISFVKEQLDRRGGTPVDLDFASLEKEVGEAIDVLTTGGENIGVAALNVVKALLAGRAKIFQVHSVRTWLSKAEVRTRIVAAVEAQTRGEPLDSFATGAIELFEAGEGDDSELPYVAFFAAVAFAALSVLNKLSPGEKVIVGLLHETLSRLPHASMSAAAASLHQRLIDDLVRRELNNLRRIRFLDPDDITSAAERFAERLSEQGDLASGSAATKAEALAWCARWLSRTNAERATKLLRLADELAPSELTLIGKAFIEAKAGWAAGVNVLRPIDHSAMRQAAALFIRSVDADPAEVVQWARDAGITAATLDAEGRFRLLSLLVEAEQWEPAAELAAGVNDADGHECPAIMHLAGLTHLAMAMHHALRSMVFSQVVPLSAADFPLSDEPEAIVHRRTAASLLKRFDAAATDLGALERADAARRTALWLELRDPDTKERALAELAEMLGRAEAAVGVIPLALQFDIKLDEERVEEALRRDAALNPDRTVDVALARLAMTLHKSESQGPTAGIQYLERHRDVLRKHIVPPVLIDLEVNLLAATGSTARAADLIAERAHELATPDVERLKRLLSGRTSEIEQLERALKAEPGPAQRRALVIALRRQGFSERLLHVWRDLVEDVRSTGEVEEFIRYLQAHGKFAEADELLDELVALIPSSRELRAAAAWKAFRRGEFGECDLLLTGLRAERDDQNDRSLTVNLLVSAGRWPELHGFVEEEWKKRTERLPQELLSLAQIAAQIGSRRVKGLLLLAAEKAPTDPQILVSCYTIASQNGLDTEEEPHRWLAAAAEYSTEEGPLRSASLEDLVAAAPEWNARVEEVRRKWRKGEIPIWLAAKGLRRSALDLQLSTLFHNRREQDVRKRSVVPAFSGAKNINAHVPRALALDLTAIVSLAALDLLDLVLERGPVRIAHTTLANLFTERSKIDFHQPSRVASAKALLALVSSGKLSEFKPTVPADQKLSALVGDDLAQMIAAARQADGKRKLVVRPGPVHRAGSLQQELVDLSSYGDLIVGCQALVKYLSGRGLVTFEEEQRADVYLRAHEVPWDDEPALVDGAELYLDDLAVAYLQPLGLLPKLRAAGLQAFVSPDQLQEANAFVALEEVAKDGLDLIERVRDRLAAGLRDGGVVALPSVDGDDGEAIHPSMALVESIGASEALIVDDRFLNRFDHLSSGNSPVFSTADLIATLAAEGVIAEADVWRLRAEFRRMGYLHVPLSSNELIAQLGRARMSGEALVETAELRAIRESVALSQIGGWLSLPGEQPWLVSLQDSTNKATLTQWADEIADVEARAKSQWLFRLGDGRLWSGAAEGAAAEIMARYGLGFPLIRLILGYQRVAEPARLRYAAWLGEVFQGLRSSDPSQIEWTLAHFREVLLTRLPEAEVAADE